MPGTKSTRKWRKHTSALTEAAPPWSATRSWDPSVSTMRETQKPSSSLSLRTSRITARCQPRPPWHRLDPRHAHPPRASAGKAPTHAGPTVHTSFVFRSPMNPFSAAPPPTPRPSPLHLRRRRRRPDPVGPRRRAPRRRRRRRRGKARCSRRRRRRLPLWLRILLLMRRRGG